MSTKVTNTNVDFFVISTAVPS